MGFKCIFSPLELTNKLSVRIPLSGERGGSYSSHFRIRKAETQQYCSELREDSSSRLPSFWTRHPELPFPLAEKFRIYVSTTRLLILNVLSSNPKDRLH